MKKLILTIILTLFASTAFALPTEDTCEEHLYPMNTSANSPIVLLIYCMADSADASLDGYVISAATINSISGMYVHKVIAFPGGTAPTTDSDLTIVASMAGGGILSNNQSYDILGGNGTNLIDNTDTRDALTEAFSQDLDYEHIIDKNNTYTLVTANQAVNSATFGLKIILDYQQ